MRSRVKHLSAYLVVRRSSLRGFMEFFRSLDYRVECNLTRNMMAYSRIGAPRPLLSCGIAFLLDGEYSSRPPLGSSEALYLLENLRNADGRTDHRDESLPTVREGPAEHAHRARETCSGLASICKRLIKSRFTTVIRLLQRFSGFSPQPPVRTFLGFVRECRFRSARRVWYCLAGSSSALLSIPAFLKALKDMGYPGDRVKLAACLDPDKTGVIHLKYFFRMFES